MFPDFINQPGPGNGRSIDPRGILMQILARAQQGAFSQQPGSNQSMNNHGVHQQVSQLAQQVSNSRLPLGQARPNINSPLPHGSYSPSLPPGALGQFAPPLPPSGFRPNPAVMGQSPLLHLLMQYQ